MTTVGGLLELIDRVGGPGGEVLREGLADYPVRPVASREPGVMRTVSASLLQVVRHESEHLGYLELTEQLWRARN